MIDTVDVFYEFSSYTYYKACYQAVDKIAREKGGQALHKDGEKYQTTALANLGVLNIKLFRGKCRYCCYMFLQPARLIYPGSHLRLAIPDDFPEILRRLNEIIADINRLASFQVLPSIEEWRVSRIDYAFDIETPYVAEYLRLFKAGFVPAGFSGPKPYESSYYLTSTNGNINFYNKLLQVKEKYGLSDEDIIKELNYLPEGVLRLEFQCHNRWLQHLKKSCSLFDTTFLFLFNPKLACKELKSRVASIIGKAPFFPYDVAVNILSSNYKNRTMGQCCQIMSLLKDFPKATLDTARTIVAPKRKNDFAQLIHKIRKVGINPIPVEVARRDLYDGQRLSCLPNPYDMIYCAQSLDSMMASIRGSDCIS